MSLVSAIVLKNYAPAEGKILLLHKELGKILCHYPSKSSALWLGTGSLLLCSVKYDQSRRYDLEYSELYHAQGSCTVDDIFFLHQIILFCIKNLPYRVKSNDLFDYLWYVLSKMVTLTVVGRKIVLMRLFLFFDLLPEESTWYLCAIQDPYIAELSFSVKAQSVLDQCWKKLAQSNNQFSKQ